MTPIVDQQKLNQRWNLLATEGCKAVGVTPRTNPLKQAPSWYDPQRFRRSQILAKKYFLSLNIAHFIGNILLVHLPDVLVPVLATGHSATPYMVFMRILSTVIHVMSWYDDDPFDENSKTHGSLLTVRRNCHMAVSRLMNGKYPRKNGRLWLSQFDMAMTQWSLIGIVGIRPKQCGFYQTTNEEFEEYIYFWKVIGYCVGIEDRFNVCLDHYEESVTYLNICFERCYKVHLDRQCKAVKLGMQLTEGVFLGINSVTPKIITCHESFMKYWYDTLGVKHSIRLNTIPLKIYYWSTVFIFDHLLRWRIVYILFSYVFFYLQRKLFTKINEVKTYTDKHYGHIRYELECDYFDDIDSGTDEQQQQILLNNELNVSEKNLPPNDLNNNQKCVKPIFEINNYFYRPNVKAKTI